MRDIIHVMRDLRELKMMMQFVGDTFNDDLMKVHGDIYDYYLGSARNIAYKTENRVHICIRLEEINGRIEISDSDCKSKIVLLVKGVKGRNQVRQFYNENIAPLRNEYRYILSTVKDEDIADITKIYLPAEDVRDVSGEATMQSDGSMQSIITIGKGIPHVVIRRRVEDLNSKKYITCEIHEIRGGDDVYSEAFTGFPYERFTTEFAPGSMGRFERIVYMNASFSKPTCMDWVDITPGFRL